MSKREPKIRFRGFTAEWEEHRLVDYFSERIERSSRGNMLSVTISEGIVLASSLDRKDNSSADKKNYKLVKVNDIAYNSMRMWQAALGVSNYEGIVSPAYTVLIPNDSVDSNFFGYQFKQTKMKRIFQRNSQGLTSDTWNLKYPLFSRILTSAPSFDEQSEIGYFFKKLDELITLKQKQLDLLKEQKKGFLQKMFPKAGEVVPEIRFAGFADDWERRKFLDNIKSVVDFRGRTPKKLNMDWSKKGYLALSALNVKNGYIDLSVEAHYGDQKLYDRWMTGKELYKDQVLFTTEAPMGNVAQVPDNSKYILSQRTIAFDVISDKITNDFLAVLLRSPKSFNELSALASGGTAKGVSQRSLSQFKIMLPTNLKEQQKIGCFFKRLDATISIRQHQQDLLKEMKKGFLQQMFI